MAKWLKKINKKDYFLLSLIAKKTTPKPKTKIGHNVTTK